MRRMLLVVLLFLPMAAAAMDKPQEIDSYIHAEKAYGEGKYTRAMFTAYDASLWTDEDVWSMDSVFALSIQYNMNFSGQDLVRWSLNEMQKIQPLSDADRKDYGAQLAALFPSVKKGDVITALHLPRKEAIVFYNGKPTGNITDTVFVKRFFDIWLSDKTSAPNLRKALIAAN